MVAAKRRRKNAEDSTEIERAKKVTEEFHGRPVKWVKDVADQYVFRPVHARLGELRELWVGDHEQAAPIKFGFKRPALGVTPDCRSLYVLGGQQTFDVAGAGLVEKDRVIVGPLVRVVYFTTKDFHDFEPTLYVHDFGVLEDGNEELLEPWQKDQVDEDGFGPLPALSYDLLNERFSIDGGAYSVRREGIVF